jgi:hypothetical protein
MADHDLDDSVELWRYMALGPFLTMLISQALYQTRVDSFEDASEGAFGYKAADLNPVAAALKMQYRSFSDDQGPQFVPPRKEEIIAAARATTAVTCWFQYAGSEKFSMWRIYARDTFGVAVVTTLGALKQVFRGIDSVRIRSVSYVELPSQVPDVHSLFFHKRAEYSDECEIRTVNVSDQPFIEAYPSIVLSPNNLNALLGSVVAAPGMSKTMFDSLYNIIEMQFRLLGLAFSPERLRQSTLDDDLV